MSNDELPDWERALSSAARLQQILPDAVLVGGTASAVYASHRVSVDADHVLTDLKARFDEVLAELESVAGWKTARVQRPVQILDSLNGILTGVRQLIRAEPLETAAVTVGDATVTLPTEAEMLRIKGVLILKRNATRDYVDFVALADHLGEDATVAALQDLDRLYPQDNGESPLQQLEVQLANPIPYDLDNVNLAEYKQLTPALHDWEEVKRRCCDVAALVFDRSNGLDDAANHRYDGPGW
jgi:hypothetical protein